MKQIKNKKEKGVTLIALVVTIIVLIVLAGISINLIFGNLGIVTKEKEAKEENIKQTAKEVMNLKITSIQIENYTENKTLPSLQFLADKLCEDNDMEYVLTQSKAHASLDKIDTTNLSSIYTKLKEYPYEFEINDSLQLASIDGVKIADNNKDGTNKNENYSLEEQVIGKWIDGKNIYRKTIKIDVNNNTNYTFDAKSILSTNIGSIINTYGYSVVDGGETYASFPCYYTERAHLSSYMDIPTGKIHISSGEQYKTATHYLTFEYTKTTD